MICRIIFLALYGCFFTTAYSQSPLWKAQVEGASIFSSPRLADLNKDGILDVVVGGGVENSPSKNGVIAIDGDTGEALWKVSANTQIYTSALFLDINDDTIPDVFIGGRAANYFAIDGASGEIIWEFFTGTQNESRKAGFLNFFGTQFVEDVDGDGHKDLLLTNGGDYLAKTGETDRPAAQLMIVSSATGEILQSALVPDNKESYYSPHVFSVKGKQHLVYGTGGETIGGALYTAPYDKFLKKGTLENSKMIFSDTAKGFILNSVLTDLNDDEQLDIVAASMNGVIAAADGSSGKELWSRSFPGKECYVTPSLGMFNSDDTPDVFTILAKGTFPMYNSFELLVLDGKTGDIIFQRKRGVNQFSPAAVANIDEDKTDEIIYLENEIIDAENYKVENRVCLYDIEQGKATFIGPNRPGMSMASSPIITDLQGDGKLEVVVCTSTVPVREGELPNGIIECISLPDGISSIRWPAYLGPDGNGILKK